MIVWAASRSSRHYRSWRNGADAEKLLHFNAKLTTRELQQEKYPKQLQTLTYNYKCYYHQWVKHKTGEGGSLSISGPLRDPADISRCIVDVYWAPGSLDNKILGPGLQIWQDPAYFNH